MSIRRNRTKKIIGNGGVLSSVKVHPEFGRAESITNDFPIDFIENPQEPQYQELAKMKVGSVLLNILSNVEWSRKEKAKLLVELLGSTTNPEERAEIIKQLKELKIKHFSDISNFSIEELKRYTDEMYLSMNREQLVIRRMFLNEDGTLPKEIADPDTMLGRGFYVFWGIGGEEYKPTKLMDIIKMNINHEHELYRESTPLNGDEWEKQNERTYYENIYKALSRPIVGGKKRKTHRKIKKRKTHRKIRK
jgi:hypothetical protein